jgi:thiamine biosynthesis protein ThiS
MSIRILINSKEEILEKEMTVAELLKKKNIRPEVVTVELNEKIINREDYPLSLLKEGDTLEFVFFMGGGVLQGAGSNVPRLPEGRSEARAEEGGDKNCLLNW